MEKIKLQLTLKNEQVVSAELVAPENPLAMITLAHGAGAGMNHPFMVSLALALAERSIATLRYNFLYMELKKKRPDVPALAHAVVDAALVKVQSLYPSLPIFVSGKSFGGRMSSQYLAAAQPTFVKGIIFFGFPLHPAGQPSTQRAEHLSQVKCPQLFIQGTRDDLAHWPLITSVCNQLLLATLCAVEGADHSFKRGKENSIPHLADITRSWIQERI